jgi:hypothetical protein
MNKQLFPSDENEQEIFYRLNNKIKSYTNVFGQAIDEGSRQRRFIYGDQWSSDSREFAKKYNISPLVQNEIIKHIKALVAEFSNNFPNITSHAKASNSNANDVELFNAIINNIAKRQSTVEAITAAYEDAITTGCTAGLYLYTDYKNINSFEQEIFVKYIPYTSIIFDAYAESPTKYNGNICGYIIRLEENEYNAMFGKDSFNKNTSFGELYSSYDKIDNDTGIKGKTVAHIFEKIYYPIKMYLTNEQRIIYDEKELFDNERIIKERQSKKTKIFSYFLDGKSVLKMSPYPFDFLPVIGITGHQKIIDGIVKPYAFGYEVFDLQKLKNWSLAQIGSTMLNLRKENFLIDKRSVTKKELEVYKKPLLQQGCLFYDSAKGREPIQLRSSELSSSLLNVFTGSGASIDNTLGRFEDVQGASNGNISGIARKLSITQNNIAQYYYVRNAVLAIKTLCSNIAQMLPKIYVEERILQTDIGDILINKQSEDNRYKILNIIEIDHNAIDIEVEVGTSFEIEKQQYLENMIALISKMPQDAQVILLPELLSLYNIPNVAKINEKISRYLKYTQPILGKIMNDEMDQSIDQLIAKNQEKQEQLDMTAMQEKQLDLLQKQKLIEALDEEKNLNKVKQELETRKQRANELKGIANIFQNSEKIENDNIKLEQNASKMEMQKLNDLSKINKNRTQTIIDLINSLTKR